jgi:putative membrane protein
MHKQMKRRRVGMDDVAKGAVAGLAAGLAGTWAMSEFQGWWSRAVDGREPQSAGGRHDARDWQEKEEGQNANEKVAQAVATQTLDRPLTEGELAVAAPAVHYAFGASMGALYGGLIEVAPARPSAATGAAFGTALWVGADELAVPALGLSQPDADYSVDTHLQAWAAHLVYGVTTELVRRGVRRML